MKYTFKKCLYSLSILEFHLIKLFYFFSFNDLNFILALHILIFNFFNNFRLQLFFYNLNRSLIICLCFLFSIQIQKKAIICFINNPFYIITRNSFHALFNMKFKFFFNYLCVNNFIFILYIIFGYSI